MPPSTSGEITVTNESPRPAHDAAESGNPQIVMAVFANSACGAHGDVDLRPETGELAVPVTSQIDSGDNPQVVVVVGIEGGDCGIRQALFGGVGVEPAAPILGQTVLRSNPERTIVGRGQGRNGIVRQVAVALAEDHELVAIETRQAFIGAQPEIAVFGLRDGADRILRQPAFLRPESSRILGKAFARVQGQCARSQAGRQHTQSSDARAQFSWSQTFSICRGCAVKPGRVIAHSGYLTH